MSNSMHTLLDRRSFLGGVTLTVGGAVVTSLLPVSLLQAAPAAGLACGYQDPCGDWTVDDMCGAYPPYAFRVDTGIPHAGRMTAHVEPVDQMWVS
jgi:hypothetical protein